MASSAWKIIPQFPSTSIQQTVDFYRKNLHFEVGGVSTSEATGEAVFCSAFLGRKAEANIYFSLASEGQQQGLGIAMIALGTEQLDEYYSLLQRERSVTIVEPIEDKDWGYRQFGVVDPDGNRLRFFRFLEGGNPGGDGGVDLSKSSS